MNFNYLNHKKFDKLPNEIETISNRNVKKDSGLKETNREKDGTTSVNEVNNIAEYINSVAEKPITENSEETKLYAPTSNAANDVSNTSNDEPYNPNTNIVDFIKETLQNAGIDVSDEQMIQIIAKVIEESIQGNLIELNIKNVTDLIDLNLESEQLADMKLITELIDSLLQGNPHGRSGIMCSEVRAFILEAANEIITQQPATPDPVEPDTPNIPTVATTPEEAMEILQAKLANATPDENMTIEEFLLQFENDVSTYLQLQYNYGESFAGIVAKYLANAMDDNYNNPLRSSYCEYNKYNGGDIEKVKSFFIDFLKNDFENDPNMTSFVQLNNSGLYAWTTNGGPHPLWNPTICYNCNSDGYTLSGNNDIGYNNFGYPNSGTLFKFMTNYLRDEVYGGNLNESQLGFLYKKILYDFSNGVCNYNENNKTSFGNKNLEDFWNSMMKIAEQYPPLPTNNIESLDLDMLFGDTNLTNAAPAGYIRTDVLITNFVNQKKCDYFFCDDPGLRVFISTLFDRAKELKINRDVDYQEFFNTFVEELNKKCGMTTKYWYGHKAELSREALEKYLENNTVDDLVDFINSKELRDIHYMKSFEINGEIEGFGQGISYDCSLLSDLIALSGSEKGRNTLKDSIIDNGDGTYSVILKGGYKNGRYVVLDEPAVYTFTLEQLFDARESGKYSVGDWDTLLIELAIAAHREACEKHPNTSGNGDPYLNFLDMGETIHYFTGNCMAGTSFYASQGKSRAQNFYEYILNAFTSGAIADIDDGNIGDYAILVSIDMNNGTSHAYAVHEVTSEGIWLVNPGSSEKPIYYTWEQFLTELPITGIKLYQL